MNYEQEAPFAIQVEMTRGCNLQCDFCGINGFQERPNKHYDFMTLVTADKIATNIKASGWNSRIEFAMHGEPTMNPHYLDIIEIFRKRLPKHQLMLTSNGGGIVRREDIHLAVTEMFLAGLNILAIDEYQGVAHAANIYKGIDQLELSFDDLAVYRYPEEKKGNPHARTKENFITFISPINISTKGNHASLNNHCGSGADLDYSMVNALCAKPFREMAITWDGKILFCCNDFLEELSCGSVYNEDIVGIWNNHIFNAGRRILMGRNRNNMRPCKGCNARSYRVGLLPDKKGKVTLPKHTDDDMWVIIDNLNGKVGERCTKRYRDNVEIDLTDEEVDNLGLW